MNKAFQYLMTSAMLLTPFQLVKAQEQPGLREKANQHYISSRYVKAASIYVKLADAKKPRLSDLERLADCYLKMSDYEAAENWYARIIEFPDSKTENLISYGAVLKFNSRYAEAKKVLQQYAEKSGDAKGVANALAGCDSALVWIAKPTGHKLRNESAVNTAFAEFGVFPIGNKAYYVAEPDNGLLKKKDGRTGNPFLRIYTADRNPDQTLTAKLIDKSAFNKEAYHIGPIISNKKGNLLYITRTYIGKAGARSKAAQLNLRTRNLELYMYTAENGGYTASPFPYNHVQQYSVGHAALSQDEQTLYFVSDMPGGFGHTDIWYSELQSDGKWGQPINAGPEINTPGDEMFPFMNAEGVLYYSSNGLPGMGGLDIFAAKGAKRTWSRPLNLKYPVNSAADDFAFVTTAAAADGPGGYLSSNRKGGVGDDDIYSFSTVNPKMILALQGVNLNRKTTDLLSEVAITLYSGARSVVAKQSSKHDGSFFFELEKETDYTLLGQKTGFYSDSVSLSTKGLTQSDTLKVTLRLEPLFEKGKTIALQNIHYDFDKDNIRKDAAKILDELVRIMRDNPTLEIELGSHTDSRGMDRYNLDLSQRRAASVVDYLVSRGTSRNRLTAKGYGATKLLNRCANGVQCSAEEHQANRRTEFKVLSY
ncbi:OmpA family protein [Pedobacter steynii]|nr:OmpA family protein [Pedobacter steynii]